MATQVTDQYGKPINYMAAPTKYSSTLKPDWMTVKSISYLLRYHYVNTYEDIYLKQLLESDKEYLKKQVKSGFKKHHTGHEAWYIKLFNSGIDLREEFGMSLSNEMPQTVSIIQKAGDGSLGKIAALVPNTPFINVVENCKSSQRTLWDIYKRLLETAGNIQSIHTEQSNYFNKELVTKTIEAMANLKLNVKSTPALEDFLEDAITEVKSVMAGPEEPVVESVTKPVISEPEPIKTFAGLTVEEILNYK